MLEPLLPKGNKPGRPPKWSKRQRAARAVVESVLVEKNPSDFKRLAGVVAEYQSRGVRCEALPGDVVQHLPAVVEQATGVPLFMFLDPCGANVPFDKLAAVSQDRAAADGHPPKCYSTSAPT